MDKSQAYRSSSNPSQCWRIDGSESSGRTELDSASGGRRFLLGGFGGLLPALRRLGAVLLREALHAAFGIDQLLLAR